MDTLERELEVRKQMLKDMRGKLLSLRDEWDSEITDEPKHSIPNNDSKNIKYKCRMAWFTLIVNVISDFRRYFWDKIDENKREVLINYKRKMSDMKPGNFWDSHEKMEVKGGNIAPRVKPEDIVEGDKMIKLILEEIDKIEKAL